MALFWHAKWRRDRRKVLVKSLKPIIDASLSFALDRWRTHVYNKRLLFRVFANCEKLWIEKRNAPYEIENIHLKRNVLNSWLSNAQETKILRTNYAKALGFNELCIKVYAFMRWRNLSREMKRLEASKAKDSHQNKLIADTFRAVSLKSKVLDAWRERLIHSWRERLAVEMGYRSIARRALCEWKALVLLRVN